MKIQTKTLEITPGIGFSVQNITHLVDEFVCSAGVQEGQLLLFYKHTTGSIIIGEYEAGVIVDLKRSLELIAPENGVYAHHLREVDFNGYSHVRAAYLPSSQIIPIQGGRMILGTHQEIQVVDNQPEELPRFVVMQVMGE